MYWLLFNHHYQHCTNQKLRSWANAVFQNRGVCGQAFPSLPSPSSIIPYFFLFLSQLSRRTRAETLAMQANSDHGRSNEPMNPLWTRIHWFIILIYHDPSDLGSLILIRIISKEFSTVRSRFGHFTTNDKLRFGVNGFTLPVWPYLELKVAPSLIL